MLSITFHMLAIHSIKWKARGYLSEQNRSDHRRSERPRLASAKRLIEDGVTVTTFDLSDDDGRITEVLAGYGGPDEHGRSQTGFAVRATEWRRSRRARTQWQCTCCSAVPALTGSSGNAAPTRSMRAPAEWAMIPSTTVSSACWSSSPSGDC